MLLQALHAVSDGSYTGIGVKPTFRGKGKIAVSWRLMAGLVDRDLVDVLRVDRMVTTGEVIWKAVLTDAGKTALAAPPGTKKGS